MNFLSRFVLKLKTTLVEQLKQGVSPEKLAQSVATGAVIGLFPIIGPTTVMCAVSGVVLKLNHVAVQSVHYALYPIQIALIIPYIKMGEWLSGRPEVSLNLQEMLAQFRENFLLAIQKYASLGLLAIFAWAISAPFVFYLVRFLSKPFFSKVLASLQERNKKVVPNSDHQ